VLRIYKALPLPHLNDFNGVLELYECLIRPSHGDAQHAETGMSDSGPGEHRLAMVLCGLAQAGLGNVSLALEYFAEAERRMESQPVMFDWYWRLPLEWGWANALIAGGDLTAGKLRAQRFIDLAESTDERTWQGLAWETQARAALAQGGAREAREHIAKALAASEEFDKPLADWRML